MLLVPGEGFDRRSRLDGTTRCIERRGIKLGCVELERGDVVLGQAEIEVRLGSSASASIATGSTGEPPPDRARADRHR